MQEALLTADVRAKPFLKWAGGKTQLLEQMKAFFPPELKRGEIKLYIEPFLGSGAVFFHVAQGNYGVSKFYLFDINEELVLTYRTIKRDVSALIEELCKLEEQYLGREPDDRETFFYDQRKAYNEQRQKVDFQRFDKSWVDRTAKMIFLNRTCFNGLFRVSAKGYFNVPFGRYANPQICNRENLNQAARLLQRATIEHGDFETCKPLVNSNTFVYFDPPYRPISTTSSFTSYSKHEFGDNEQKRLAEFYSQLDAKGAKLMLSNSDPKNGDAKDPFFEELYQGFNIKRVKANRMINADASKRGKISEILVMNYG
jgi:DNA adenine methylase